MFIQCSSCNSKYLVNSADLKPNGRLVECANCTHQWYQELKLEDDLSVKSFLEEMVEVVDGIENIIGNLLVNMFQKMKKNKIL